MIKKNNIVGPLRDQSDWEQTNENRLGFIKNKPFYDTRKTAPLTIEWDGNTEGKESFHGTIFGDNIFYKISENVPSYEEFLQGEGTVYLSATGEEGLTQETSFSLTETQKLTDSNGNTMWYTVVLDGVGLIVTPNSFVSAELEIMRGIWAVRIHESYDDGVTVNCFIKSLHFPAVTAGELKTIDPKYLPNETAIIKANDFGIDIPTIGMSGKKITYIDTQPIFEEINKHQDFVIECDFDTSKITLVPVATVRRADGIIGFISLSFEYVLNGVIIHFNIGLLINNTVICTTSQTPLN